MGGRSTRHFTIRDAEPRAALSRDTGPRSALLNGGLLGVTLLSAAVLCAALMAAGCTPRDDDAQTSGGRQSAERSVNSEPSRGTPARQQGAAPEAGLSPIRFFREHVTVEPSHGLTRVSALYHFRNESDRAVRQAIRYPFPVDAAHAYPASVRVWEVKPDGIAPMAFTHETSSVRWVMTLGGAEEKVVRVDYTQQIRGRHAIYIVTTTQEWKRPIELAEFEFRIPAGMEGVRLSFEPDRVSEEGDTTVYYMRREQFMPDEDLVVTWE